ncbi:unnamed protein product, partial [Mesorhabditis belari]|uniref:Rho GTPase-activating protein 39 n=1 Tax=Mesorhabditis belari TaxID=2138241 RepID=A0AAF3F825_9BILA
MRDEVYYSPVPGSSNHVPPDPIPSVEDNETLLHGPEIMSQPQPQLEVAEVVEIVEPQTKQRMYANLTTGKCSWDPPIGTRVKRTHENQWWELFDSKTNRFYYYNASSMKTMWARPTSASADIIPLAKLQTLKENTDQSEHARARKHCETQTSPAVRRAGPRRIIAQNIGPETGIVTTRSPSYSHRDLDTSFDMLSLDDVSERSLTSSQIGRPFPPFPTTASRMSTAPSADSLPTRSSRSSSPPQQKRGPFTFSTNTGTKTKSPGGWAKDAPKAPLTAPDNKALRKESAAIFKLIQSYMGDKKSKLSPDQLALSLCETTTGRKECADEAIAQLMQQLTDNLKSDSLRRGWELLAILLALVAPSTEMADKLSVFLDRHSDSLLDSPEVAVSNFAHQCHKRLEKNQPKFKPTLALVQESRVHIFNPPQFSANLEELMDMQAARYPHLQLPWIETTLIELILREGGTLTEGLFRVPADPEQMNTARARLDQWVVPVLRDPHVPAGLLKLWLRQLPEPLIPHSFYTRALAGCDNPLEATRLVDLLPNVNRLVLAKLISLLQDLSMEEVIVHTKMDPSNLAMVMAPNVLRCESEDPRVIFDNTRREMTFLKTLITHYDTAFIRSLL